jgi:uncharacterized protein YbjT (DUF2867 family)
MKTRVLLAGATGAVGRVVLEDLRARGAYVRTLSKDAARARSLVADDVRVLDATRAEALRGALDGIDVVVSCLGANVSLRAHERRSYADVDARANLALVEEAARAGVSRFVYLGVHTGPAYATTRYCVAHERVAMALRDAPMTSTVVRPTGIYTAFDDFLAMARFGVGFVLGDGRAKTNPVGVRDVARACTDVLEHGPSDLDVGGPEVLTRRRIVELAFEALGKKPRIVHVPLFVPRMNALLLRPLHPRLSELFEFISRVMATDCVAPARGEETLSAYLAARAQRKALAA